MSSDNVHVAVDVSHCEDPEILGNVTTITFLIETLCTELNLTPIGTPLVHAFPMRLPPCGGITAVQILAESSLSIHTAPEYASTHVDIFTCGNKSIDQEKFLDVLKTFFGTSCRTHLNLMKRMAYPVSE